MTLDEALMTPVDLAVLMLRQVAWENGSKLQSIATLEFLAKGLLKWD